jgi:hypothetical protein
MGVIGDMQRFQAFQLGQSIPDLAKNPAGGIATAGMGIGMGFGVAQQMGGTLGAAPRMGPPPLPQVTWYVAVNGQQQGPFSMEQLAGGGLTPQMLVWSPALAGWMPAGQVPELAAIFQRQAPPPPPPPLPK